MVAEHLGVSQEEAEVWIVNLIRNANMEAKIDLEKGILVLTSSQPSVYERVFTLNFLNENINYILDSNKNKRFGSKNNNFSEQHFKNIKKSTRVRKE